MKLVQAYVQPFMLQRVLHEIRAIHVHGITVSDARGFGREKDESYPHAPADYAVDFTPKLKLELICRDGDADATVEAIVRGAHTGRRGDGKIFVTPVDRTVSILSRKEGDEAI